jgi:para-aminobenzoate synthetase component 1
LENVFCYTTNNNSFIVSFGISDELLVYGHIDWRAVDAFIEKNQSKFIHVLLNYNLKNSIEKLSSKNADPIEFPLLALIVPKAVCTLNQNEVCWIMGEDKPAHRQFVQQKLATFKVSAKKTFQPQLSKEEYILQVKKAKEQIQLGNVYELNFCQQFLSEGFGVDNGIALYLSLHAQTKAPFSVYFNWKNWQMFGASPERFLKKEGKKLLSQPIKGTRPRALGKEDERLKEELRNDRKERAENIMIVDLVRNDLARIAQAGSVNVEELCEIYSFETVHQMISSISCTLKNEVKFSEIVRATFPMGSMTGAPKISAMEVIDELENFSRGIYSGSVGYIQPNGDFDLNVVIRSIVVNKRKQIASCAVGSAITILSNPENEYEECLVKIRKILAIIEQK